MTPRGIDPTLPIRSGFKAWSTNFAPLPTSPTICVTASATSHWN